MQVKPNDPLSSDKINGSEIPTVTPPSVGDQTEIKIEETPPTVTEIADISDEVNAQVIEAVKIEEQQIQKDEELETNYDDLLEYEIEENEPSKSNTKMILGVLVVGLGFGYYALTKNKKQDTKEIQSELDHGKDQSVTTDEKTGFVY